MYQFCAIHTADNTDGKVTGGGKIFVAGKIFALHRNHGLFCLTFSPQVWSWQLFNCNTLKGTRAGRTECNAEQTNNCIYLLTGQTAGRRREQEVYHLGVGQPLEGACLGGQVWRRVIALTKKTTLINVLTCICSWNRIGSICAMVYRFRNEAFKFNKLVYFLRNSKINVTVSQPHRLPTLVKMATTASEKAKSSPVNQWGII